MPIRSCRQGSSRHGVLLSVDILRLVYGTALWNDETQPILWLQTQVMVLTGLSTLYSDPVTKGRWTVCVYQTIWTFYAKCRNRQLGYTFEELRFIYISPRYQNSWPLYPRQASRKTQLLIDSMLYFIVFAITINAPFITSSVICPYTTHNSNRCHCIL